MKLNYGSLTNPKTEATEQIEFDVLKAVDLKSLLIGLGLTVAGLGAIVVGHIKKGGDAAMTAELAALCRAGLTEGPENLKGKFK